MGGGGEGVLPVLTVFSVAHLLPELANFIQSLTIVCLFSVNDAPRPLRPLSLAGCSISEVSSWACLGSFLFRWLIIFSLSKGFGLSSGVRLRDGVRFNGGVRLTRVLVDTQRALLVDLITLARSGGDV